MGFLRDSLALLMSMGYISVLNTQSNTIYCGFAAACSVRLLTESTVVLLVVTYQKSTGHQMNELQSFTFCSLITDFQFIQDLKPQT